MQVEPEGTALREWGPNLESRSTIYAHVLMATGEEKRANQLLVLALKEIQSLPDNGKFGQLINRLSVYTVQGETDQAMVFGTFVEQLRQICLNRCRKIRAVRTHGAEQGKIQ